MRTQTINLNGKEYLANFGMGALQRFCQIMDMPMSMISRAMEIGPIQLLYTGLERQSKKDKTILPWSDWQDLADHFDDFPDELGPAINQIIKAFPAPAEDVDEKKIAEAAD